MSPPGRLKTCRSGAMIESTPAECDARVKVVSFCTDRVHRFLPLQGPLAKDPTAQILHYLLSALAIWLTFSTLLVYLFTAVVARLNLFLVPSLLVMLLVALVPLRRGFLRAAGVGRNRKALHSPDFPAPPTVYVLTRQPSGFEIWHPAKVLHPQPTGRATTGTAPRAPKPKPVGRRPCICIRVSAFSTPRSCGRRRS
jgi:hypothetical protein